MGRKPKSTDTKEITVTREFQFDLTKEERDAKLEATLALETDIDAKRSEVKEFTSALRAQIKTLCTERNVIRKHLATNQEPRTVNCKEVLDFRSGTVTYLVRGKIKEERKMLDHERQAELSLAQTKKRVAKEKTPDSVVTNGKTKIDHEPAAQAGAAAS